MAASNNPLVDLNNIASVNVNLVSNTAIDETEYTNVAAVNITNGVAGTTLTVNNATLDTVYGATVAGRNYTETINYAGTTGAADVAALSASNTGNSTTDTTFNVATGNTIEAVTLATSGNNFVTLNGGTAAAKYTLTGNGTNVVTVGSAASTMTIDAAATTGTNIIDVGTLLSTTDTVLGGSGFDLLEANLTSAVQMIPTVTGVEELELTFTAAAIFNASKVTGATDLEITPVGAVNATVTNLNQSVDHVYVGEHYNGSGAAITATGAIAVGYAAGSSSDVTFDVGATATNSNPAVSIGNVTFTGNSGDLHVHSIGDAANTVGSITANSVSALHVHGETQAVTTGNLSATAAAEVMVSGELKNTTVGTIAVDETLTALNVISGAGTVTTGAVTQTSGSGAINTTYTYTGGAKALTGGAVTASTAVANADLNAVVNVAAAAGAVAVGALSFTGSGALAGDVTNVTLTAEGTESTGTVALAGLTVDEGAAGTSSTTVDLQGNGGAVTLTGLTLTASDTNSISLNADSSNVTLTTLTNTASTTTDIVVSAASGQTATIGTLAGTGNLNSVTATGAGTVSLFGTATSAVTGDTVVDATGLTGAFTLNLATAAGNLNVTLGNVVSGSSNTVIVGAGADVVVGGTGADAITANAGNDNITLGSGADTFAFANVVTAAHASAVTATVAEIVADVGSDTVTSFVVADDTFIIDQTVFGTVFAAGAATVANFDVVATTATAINAGTTDVGNIIVVQAAANAAASIYYLDSAGAGSTVAAELAAGNATLIGTISSVTGTVALTDFTVVV